jgi:hypothetical protein
MCKQQEPSNPHVHSERGQRSRVLEEDGTLYTFDLIDAQLEWTLNPLRLNNHHCWIHKSCFLSSGTATALLPFPSYYYILMFMSEVNHLCSNTYRKERQQVKFSCFSTLYLHRKKNFIWKQRITIIL